MPKFAFLTRTLPHPIAEELNAHGYPCLEALEVDEVLHLLEHENVNCVIITDDAKDLPGISEILREKHHDEAVSALHVSGRDLGLDSDAARLTGSQSEESSMTASTHPGVGTTTRARRL